MGFYTLSPTGGHTFNTWSLEEHSISKLQQKSIKRYFTARENMPDPKTTKFNVLSTEEKINLEDIRHLFKTGSTTWATWKTTSVFMSPTIELHLWLGVFRFINHKTSYVYFSFILLLYLKLCVHILFLLSFIHSSSLSLLSLFSLLNNVFYFMKIEFECLQKTQTESMMQMRNPIS